jgi:SAM-dependent methyltransferase
MIDEEDAFGQLLLDHLAGHSREPRLERDDGRSGPALSAEWFFAEHAEWPEAERDVFSDAGGRILDIGAGAGRHSLEAQRRGLEVVAIDISPGAVEVCRRRGVNDARVLALEDIDESLGAFDTVLMLCGNFGLVGSAEAANARLRMLNALTSVSGRILLDSIDPHVGADLAYQELNRARGRMVGQETIRIRYGTRVTPWYDLLMLSVAELEELIDGTGWRLARVVSDEPSEYYAVLEK